MSKVLSKDGTEIVYEKKGAGPAVVLVDGAMCYRSFGPMAELSDLLAPHFTVYLYDRRGRGESGNSKPYAVEREIEDIDALIKEAGGSAYVFGASSGGALALEAAIKLGGKIKKLAIYEVPYNSQPSARQRFMEYRKNLDQSLAANAPGDAIALFMLYVGGTTDQVNEMRNTPVWMMVEAIAPTLGYDAAILGKDASVPAERAAAVNVPTLLMDGGASYEFMPFMRETAEALAGVIPHAQRKTLEGQTHDVDLKVLAPALIEFFKQ